MFPSQKVTAQSSADRASGASSGVRTGGGSWPSTSTISGPSPSRASIRLLLADDHRMLREGLRRSLEEMGFTVVAEARNGTDLPFGPDHGHDFTFDTTAGAQPGYALIGRMRGLAELRGIIAAQS